MRVGYGGTDERINGEEQVIYNLLRGGLTVVGSQSYFNKEQEEANLQLARRIMGEQGYRAPWGADAQLRQFRSEIESAMSDGTGRFRLTPAEQRAVPGQPAGRGFFGRLFHRS